ncbi:MAG TPA: type III PLP-dependent enzyme [Pseudonocardiaceae bacterium]|jgi:diaminopimelate decarboxylase|nr:type III PLP-dependent enzyme [Pseudonocardiaceae bacterium]
MITESVRARLAELSDEQLPAYLYDLTALTEHVEWVRRCLPAEVELYYAAKANPAEPVLRALAGHAEGIEVASGGELAHVLAALPTVRTAFGGPAKSPAELAAGLAAGVHRFHVESEHELRLLALLAAERGVEANVLLRVNFPVPVDPAVALSMGGRPSQFGIDPAQVADCVRFAADQPGIRLVGVHTHLASGLTAPAQLTMSHRIAELAVDLSRATGLPLAELTIGGGMTVDYRRPEQRFDWAGFGAGLSSLVTALPGTTVRIEPGRALSAYCGWYAATVADVKRSGGQVFVLIRGGTHHFRTPAAKAHNHPFDIVPCGQWRYDWDRPAARNEPVTIAGQLCTPKDVLAGAVPVDEIRVGDRVVFGLAGAYAWNISHHDFLMHVRPGFHYLGAPQRSVPPDCAGHPGGFEPAPGGYE